MAITWSATAWAVSTAYILGARVVNGARVYVATQPGTSAGSGPGPTGTDSAITDGGVIWRYVGAASVWTVVGVAPELATLPAATQVLALAAGDKLDPEMFGASLDEAAAYLAAHVGTLSKQRGHGAVTSESEGPFSRSYAAPLTASWGDLGLTSYGAHYDALVRSSAAVFGVVAGEGMPGVGWGWWG